MSLAVAARKSLFFVIMLFSAEALGIFAPYEDCGKAGEVNSYHVNAESYWESQPSATLREVEMLGMAAVGGTSMDKAKVNLQQFLTALTVHKREILELYKRQIDSADYDDLAMAAIGILGAESSFYWSPRYELKRLTSENQRKWLKCHVRKICMIPLYFALQCYLDNQNVASCLLKKSGLAEPLSNGPTQIKEIPSGVREHFGITGESLFANPEHAAIATVAFLIELKTYVFNIHKNDQQMLPELSHDNYMGYLVYFYQGKGRRVLKGEVPSPGNNRYYKRFLQALDFVEIDRSCSKDSQTSEHNPEMRPLWD